MSESPKFSKGQEEVLKKSEDAIKFFKGMGGFNESISMDMLVRAFKAIPKKGLKRKTKKTEKPKKDKS